MAKLPFISDPKVRLKPNEGMAFKVFQAQVRKLEKNPEDKIQVINSKKKLQELGFVEYLLAMKTNGNLKISYPIHFKYTFNVWLCK